MRCQNRIFSNRIKYYIILKVYMKFSEKLTSHLTPEWRKQYISYSVLKSMILHAVENMPDPENSTDNVRNAYFNSFEEEFFEECHHELMKINNFYAEKLAEASRRYNQMVQHVKHFMDRNPSRSSHYDQRAKLPKQTTNQLKLAFSELYLSFVLLQNYQTLNFTGFRKILKKHDKLLNTDKGTIWFKKNVETAPFYTNREIMRLIKESENFFTHYLEGGNRTTAMNRLRVPPMIEKQLPWTTFRVGLLMGFFTILSIVAVISYKIKPYSSGMFLLHLYRGPLLIIILLFGISINIMGWRACGVNHILIFEIEPRRHLRATEVMEISALLAVLWILSLLGVLYYEHLNVPPMVFPLALILTMFIYIINPLPILHSNARWWFVKTMGRTVCAPFYEVTFADFWMGDQLNSLVQALIDLEFLCCTYMRHIDWYKESDHFTCGEGDYFVRPFVRCLPAWFRFAQCMRRYYSTRSVHPFLINAGKYASTFPVVVFSTFMIAKKEFYSTTFENPYVWAFMISQTISTFYCLMWDLLRDFGVLKIFSGRNVFLRNDIIYQPIAYYLAMLYNIFVRFFWILGMYFNQSYKMNHHLTTTTAATLEISRRFVWNFFRVEHEHTYNVGQFRAVRDISVPVLDPDDHVQILRLMDGVDNVENRYAEFNNKAPEQEYDFD